jgi:type IV pilus assembly protein PilY1
MKINYGQKLAYTFIGCIAGLLSFGPAFAAPLNIADIPLFLPGAVSPLNMLVMGRDHKLYYEAYNDHSDLNGDGTLDVGYKPDSIDYYGYFDSRKCYTYDVAGTKFTPVSVTADKTCSGQWSGDWLNYVTTARMDALRKVLFGGFRRVDTATDTVLERTHVPHDAHSWVKEYRGIVEDGYDISRYTPLALPSSGTTHLFANVTLMLNTLWSDNGPTATTNPPLLRVAQNVIGPNNRAWHWASVESPDAGACYGRDGTNDGQCTGHGGSGQEIAANSTLVDYTVRVAVCVSGMLESNCRPYPNGNYKPSGLLQEYGESDAMRFGLITGSYQKSKSGGVVRKNIGQLLDEINVTTDGTFKSTNGIISTIDKLRTAGYTNYRTDAWYQGAGRGAGVVYRTTLPSGTGLVATRPFNEPEFGGMWGNPIGEMMYEAARYFSGATGPTSAFNYTSSGSFDAALGLPKVTTWTNPYANASLSCAKPFMTVISDVNASYDTDQLPGAYFPGTQPADTLGGLNVSTEATTIWDTEFGSSQNVFIGQSGNNYDGAPSPKSATSFSNIRGLSPEEPTKQGGYYAASVAKYAYTHDINPAPAAQKIQTFAVALASPLPRVQIPVNGQTVTLVPFAKSVAGSSINAAPGQFQPTNQIVDFYVETQSADGSTGSFLINFEDVEAGNDHDMDAIVRYTYAVVGGQVSVTADRLYEAGGITHHMGYAISGTTADGTYLVVQDDTSNFPYFADTPQGVSAGGCASSPYCALRPSAPQALPWNDTRLFTPGGSSPAIVLKDPLWYAAKWGGFTDSNNNNVPDQPSEWDTKGTGNPDNYFLVTNALTLPDQLRRAFNTILSRTSSASAVATNTTRLDTNTMIYQAQFRSDDWTGKLLAYKLNTDGTLGALQWDAATLIPAPDSRAIFTRNGAVPGAGSAVDFQYASLSPTEQAALDQRPDGTVDGLGSNRVAWLRGDANQQQQANGVFRNRSAPLSDIINSDPQFLGAQNFGYDALPLGTPGRDSYQSFQFGKVTSAGAPRKPMLYVGANDGMMHGFDATTGVERFAYVPSTLIPELNQLTDPGYRHRYFVDGQSYVGDAYIDRGGTNRWASVLVGTTGAGGKTVFALDVTNPDSFTANDVLWEFTDPDLGDTIGQPTVARMADGTWVAVFGNGYNSVSQRAMLYIVRLEDGALLKKIDTGVGSAGTPNGLATPSLLADGTRTVRSVYAGDLYGNLWKFDVSSSDPSAWQIAYTSAGNPAPLFIARDAAGNPQPITAPAEIGRHPRGGYMIYFGTGKFFETNDNIVSGSSQVQSFYGVWDKTASPTAIVYPANDRTTALTQQDILFEGKPAGSQFEVRVTSQNPVDWDNKRGWYIDLLSPVNGVEGERVVSLPILRDGRVIFPTLIPSANPCAFGGDGWIMELEAISGSRLLDSPLDINEDGKIDDNDKVTINNNGNTETDAVSAVRSREGILDTPAVVTTPDGDELKVATGTSGNVEVLRERGLSEKARGSWRQLR